MLAKAGNISHTFISLSTSFLPFLPCHSCSYHAPLLPSPSSMQQALFCQVPTESVLTMHDVSNIWRVPLLMESQGAHHMICK